MVAKNGRIQLSLFGGLEKIPCYCGEILLHEKIDILQGYFSLFDFKDLFLQIFSKISCYMCYE